MTVRLSEVVSFLDTTLEIGSFRDYCPNGLQVEGCLEVDKVVVGVSASGQLFEYAMQAGADLIVVHHGLIWGSGIDRITGTMATRLTRLLSNSVSLAAYHLPLDAHPVLGNNAGLADTLDLLPDHRENFGDVRGHALGLRGGWPTPLSREEAIARVASRVCGDAKLPFVFPHGPPTVRSVGLCTGAASDLMEAAARSGCDMFVTGELSERAAELARELQITLVAAGHYNTEVFGPMRLVPKLQEHFSELAVEFVDVPTPI